MITSTVFAQKIPESQRSKEVIQQLKPELTDEFEAMGLTLGLPIYIRIFKEEKEFELWIQDSSSFQLYKTYPICHYGKTNPGPKTRLGDAMAPEGFYFSTPNQLNPWSKFHLSFNVGYPNTYDRYHERTGSAIMVHGECVSVGCFAMTNDGIEEIYTIVESAFRSGQPYFRIHIFPFRMSTEKFEENKNSEWYPFWQNLKEGYDFFEEQGNIPPNVEVRNGKYIFD